MRVPLGVPLLITANLFSQKEGNVAPDHHAVIARTTPMARPRGATRRVREFGASVRASVGTRHKPLLTLLPVSVRVFTRVIAFQFHSAWLSCCFVGGAAAARTGSLKCAVPSRAVPCRPSGAADGRDAFQTPNSGLAGPAMPSAAWK